MEILENRPEWLKTYQEGWLKHFQETGEKDFKIYNRPKNSQAPAGSGVDLKTSRLLFISSAGGYLREQQTPFDAANPLGDYSTRIFPTSTPLEDLAFSHNFYDHSAVDQDPQVLVPLRHLEDLVNEGVIGELTTDVISYMGYQPDVTRTLDETIPQLLQAAKLLNPKAVLLVPA